MIILKKCLLIIVFIFLLPIAFSSMYDNTFFNKYWYNNYIEDLEFSGCGEIRVVIVNNSITNYTWHTAHFYRYGTRYKFETRCNAKRYDTLIHSHIPEDTECRFSTLDYTGIRLKTFKYWVLYCNNNTMRIAYIDYWNNIYEGVFKI